MKVLKFGGSSIGSARRMLNVKSIIEQDEENKIIVVSALRGVTDLLDTLCKQAAAGDEAYHQTYNEIEKLHTDAIVDLFKGNKLEDVNQYIHELLTELKEVIHSVFLMGDITRKTADRVLSFGERLAAYILHHILDHSALVNILELIKTNDNHGNAQVNFEISNQNIRDFFDHEWTNTYVTPGFIGSTADDEITTLGRGGSDYTAAILSAALEAERMEIWTDVDGFMTADPKKVEKAFAIEHLSYAEAMELSHFGAEVIYTPTIQPVYKKNIEVAIKNSFNPVSKGSVINDKPGVKSDTLIKGISSIDDVDLITLQGPGMVGAKGTSSRLFGCLARDNVNVILITQASSEYSITFAISPFDTQKAVFAIEREFEKEIFMQMELKVTLEKDLSIIAIVGEKMKNTPGISANLFSSLGRNGISVIATAQGSSELNISVVIQQKSLRKALNAIHEGFFLSHVKEIYLFMTGMGTVGSSLINQITAQREELIVNQNLRVHILGISNSRKMLIDENGIDPESITERLNNEGQTADLEAYVQRIADLNIRNSIFVDCTASDVVAAIYPKVLNAFISVVTANKVSCSSDYTLYKELKETARARQVKFFYETNVGAGLPIISTINDLINSGDKIRRIEAVLSGTLNFIFNELSEKVSLSKAIQMAKDKGFSEPDPRIDLSGVDVVRKILILSRDAGYQMEQKDVNIIPMLPESCFEGSLDNFWNEVAKYDDEFEQKRKSLVKAKKKWRYMAVFDQGEINVALKEVDINHPSYNLEGSNNIILITTERYKEHPMIVKGYGAGADVTAAGVFADIIRVAHV
jgi:aspartokinase/homoserine dehydrogenase 1